MFEGFKGAKGVLALDDFGYTVGVDCAGVQTDQISRCLPLLYTLYIKVCGHLTSTSRCGSSPNCSHKDRSTQLYSMSLYAVKLQSPFTGTKGFK